MEFKIIEDIKNLDYFSHFFDISNNIEITGDLEITPYEKFNPEFGCIYWYFQYLLLKNGNIIVENSEIKTEYKYFFQETEVNFEWINIIDKSNYQIRCIDGEWRLKLYNLEHINIIENYRKNAFVKYIQ